MPGLQRSCNACVSAKRRCDLATPRCSRCTAKKIPCAYMNQPASATSDRQTKWSGAVRQDEQLYVVGSASPLSKLAFERGPLFGLWSHMPHVVRLFSPVTIQRQLDILKSFVISFAQNGTASFLHHCLYDAHRPASLQYTSTICTDCVSEEDLFADIRTRNIHYQTSHMMRSAARTGPFLELLAHVQAVALLRIICMYQGQEIKYSGEEAERDEEVFWELVLILYIRAPATLPRSLSPWRAWLLAESVRRTIIVCYIILAVQSVLRRGYAAHSLCVEALPFDMRAQLWHVDNASGWEAAAAFASDEPPLVSLRQFKALRRLAPSVAPLESLFLLSFE